MPANTKPIFPLTPKNFGATFVNADGTTAKTLVTAGANGSIIDFISVISDDTADRGLVLELYNGVTAYGLGDTKIVDGAGTNGVDKAINALDVAYNPGLGNRDDRSIVLGSGWSLRARMTSAVTAAKTVTVTGSYGDY